jgi:DNA polymerase
MMDWATCTQCKLHKTARTHVLGRGTLPCSVLLIGIGPGKSEDVLGEPFIGPSGKLLDRTIQAIELMDQTYYLTNLVACRPCDRLDGPNRDPNPTEIAACKPRLIELRDSLKSTLRCVVLFGRLTQRSATQVFKEYPIHAAKHPAHILRNGGMKALEFGCWERQVAKFIRKETRWQ